MIDPIDYHYPFFSRQSIHDSEELTALELAGQIAKKLNDVIDLVNTSIGGLSGLEKSDTITNQRKLSPNGNFTGSIFGRLGNLVLSEIDSNKSALQYLSNQFSDGQTGLVVDGGFFLDTNIHKNYDGGVF